MAHLYRAANSQHHIAEKAVASGVPMTLSAWVVVNSLLADMFAIAIGHASTASMFGIYVRPAGTVRAYVHDDSFFGVAATSSSVVTVGKPAHIAAVYAANNSRSVYVNGGNKATDTSSLSAGSLNRTVYGQDFAGGASEAPFDGTVIPAVWNVALTDGEIFQLAQGAHPETIRPENLVSYLPIEDYAAGVFDQRGNVFRPVNQPKAVIPPPVVRVNPPAQNWLLSPPTLPANTSRMFFASA